MATSSIFTNFTINDEQSAERFVAVLDKAAEQPSWQPSASAESPLRDHGAIRSLMKKGKKTDE